MLRQNLKCYTRVRFEEQQILCEWVNILYRIRYALECKNNICLSVSSESVKRQSIRLIYKSTKTILKYLNDSNEQSFLKGLNIGFKATYINCQQLDASEALFSLLSP